MSERSSSPAARPRDAATLILYRRRAGSMEVLMGERHAGHSFMPNRYVFPGGRVDPQDGRVRAAGELAPATLVRLSRSCTPARARALGAAAIRETFEETGLAIGRPDPKPGAKAPAGWREFFATGLAPALDVLTYVLRAITPPYRPKRFDARFFVADADHAVGTIRGSGELLGLRWISVAEAMTLQLPRITGIVLEQIADLVDRPEGSDRPVTCYRYRHGRPTVGEE